MRVNTRINATIGTLFSSKFSAEFLFSGGPLLASLSQQAKSAVLGLGIEVSFDGITHVNELNKGELNNFSPKGAFFAVGESCMVSGDYTCALYCFAFRHRAAEAALLAAATAELDERSDRGRFSSAVTDDRPILLEGARASANLAYVLTSEKRLSMLTLEAVHIFKRSRRLLRRCLELCDLGLAPIEGHPAPWLRFAAIAGENSKSVAQGQALRDECAGTLAPLLQIPLTPTIDEPSEPLGTIQHHWETAPKLEQDKNCTHDRQKLGTFALLLALYGECNIAVKYLTSLCNCKFDDRNVTTPQFKVDDACEALLVVMQLEIAQNFLEHGINGQTPFEELEVKAPADTSEAIMPFRRTYSTTTAGINIGTCSEVSCRGKKYEKLCGDNDFRSTFEDTECCIPSCSNGDTKIKSRGSSKDCGSRTVVSGRGSEISDSSEYAHDNSISDSSSDGNESSHNSDHYVNSTEAAYTRQNFPPPRVGLFLLRSSSLRPFVEDHRTLALTIQLANKRNQSAMANSRLHVLANGNLYGAARHLNPTEEISSSVLPSSSSTSDGTPLKLDSSDSVNATLKLVTAVEARLSKWWMEALGSEAGWLLGGVHVLSMGRLPLRPADLNYLRKIFTILVVCRSRGYGVFISLDDDILLSPAALAAMVAANGDASADVALRPHNEGGLGCAMVAPTLSTGIPTVEAWMEDFLPKGGEEAEALNRCFAKAALKPPSFWNGLNLSSLATAPPEDPSRHFQNYLGSIIDSVLPWNASEWYASVWKVATPTKTSTTSDRTVDDSSRAENGWLDGPIYSSLGAGVHPVRWDLSCTVLAYKAARARLTAHFGPLHHERDSSATSGDSSAAVPTPAAFSSSRSEGLLPKLWLEASTGRYPYLCNSAWASTPEHLMAALAREDLASFAHPFDEASMSAHWLHEPIKAPLCVLRGAFGVHPLYGGKNFGSNGSTVDDAPDGLEATIHREAAVHLRAALNSEPQIL